MLLLLLLWVLGRAMAVVHLRFLAILMGTWLNLLAPTAELRDGLGIGLGLTLASEAGP